MNDKYLWLEEIESKDSLLWVKSENASTVDQLTSWKSFKQISEKISSALESKEKVPFVRFIDSAYIYNFWSDEAHVQGILRRTTIEDYQNASPAWETLIDLDLLSTKDNQKWVFHDFEISPNKKRALVSLSPGGLDADIVREYCLETKSFLTDGFSLELSKGNATWNSDNELLVMRVFGEDSVTSCGYPRTLRKWKRGDDVKSAVIIYEIPIEESFLYTQTFHFEKNSRVIVYRKRDFYSGELFLLQQDELQKISLPEKIDTYGANNQQLFFHLQEDWVTDSFSYKSGEVLVYYFDQKNVELIYSPHANTSVYSGSVTKSGLLLILDKDVKSELHLFKCIEHKWKSQKIELPQNGSLDSLVTSELSDDFYIAYDSFNSPVTYYQVSESLKPEAIKKQPSFFNHQDIEVHQHFTKSLDGTMVPYFLVHKKGLEFNSKNPTILYGYGGFEVSLKAHFSNILGIGWLDQGGVYVLSNIRGGGEYGPSWHQAALKDKRDRAYQDFFAIAEDLFKRQITSPEHLGARGGSNGGLLMGVCYTQRPDLFKAINCGVPLLDMHRYHKLLAGHSWIAEYGNPDEEIDGEYIRNLSPYHRIKENQKGNPIIFLNTSTKDDRVHPGHARKFAAKIKEFNYPFYYYENIDGGHAGASNMKELAFIEALDYAFFWTHLS